MYLRTTLLVFLILTYKSKSYNISRLVKRVNVIEQKMFQDSFAFREDIENIFEKLKDGVNCSTKELVEKEPNSVTMNTMNEKINIVLETLKRALSQEKQYIRTTLNEMLKEIKNIRSEVTSTENMCLEKHQVNDVRFEILQSEISLQKSQLQNTHQELEKAKKIIIEGWQKNADLEKQLDFLRQEIGQGNDNIDKAVKRLESKLKVLSLRQCSDSSWQRFGSSCYYVGKDSLDWKNAILRCESYGGILAEVEDESENTFLIELVNATGVSGVGAWLGANDLETEGLWVWRSSKEKLENKFTNFKESEPNGSTRENCLHLYKHASWKWNDIKCDRKMGYVCEREIL